MLANDAPILASDDEGVWRADWFHGRSVGFKWHDVYRISGSKLDCMTHVLTVVALDWDNGEYFELMDDWAGFDEAVRMMAIKITGLDPGWLDRIRAVDVMAESIEVWRRA